MRSFEITLVAKLRETPGVGDRAPGGIVPVVVTQNAERAPVYPVIVYTKISGESEVTHSGRSGLEVARYQFDIFARDPLVAREIADVLKLALDGFRGTMQSDSWSVDVGGMFLEDEGADWVDQHEVHWIRQDFSVWFGDT